MNDGYDGLTDLYVGSLAIDPKDTNIIYAGTNGAGFSPIYTGIWPGGVFKSTNGGKSWKEISNGLHRGAINSLIVDPNNTDIIYAGTGGGGVFKLTSP